MWRTVCQAKTQPMEEEGTVSRRLEPASGDYPKANHNNILLLSVQADDLILILHKPSINADTHNT